MITTEILCIIFIFLNTLFLFIKHKDITHSFIHMIVMIFTIIMGVSIIQDNALFASFTALYGVVTFIVSILQTEIG